MIKVIKGGLNAAKGFLCGSARAGFKKKGDDVGLIYSEFPAVADGMFTQNYVEAAPVTVSKMHLKQDLMAQAVVVNSGCANCCTGQRGIDDALRSAGLVAKELGIKKEDVLVASTGIIGSFLEMDKIEKVVPVLVKGLNKKGSLNFAKAIMTTDTFFKEISVSVEIAGRVVSIGGVAKGAGMIHPNMATMLCFITTDMYITRRALKVALETAVDGSFNAITIDGETSTNDCVLVLANGAAGNKLVDKEDEREFRLFTEALTYVTKELAKMIVKDGEGATKFIEITVKNCSTQRQGVRIARRVASSLLFKTCIYGGDPNWGRIAASLGASGFRLKKDLFDIYLGKRQVVRNGVSLGVKKDQLSGVFDGKEIAITVDLKIGKETARAWTCDLSEEYIKVNSRYEI